MLISEALEEKKLKFWFCRQTVFNYSFQTYLSCKGKETFSKTERLSNLLATK